MSTTEIETIAAQFLNHRDCIVYGVLVPNTDGRAGMIAVSEPFDLAAFYQYLRTRVPEYAVPKFVRVTDQLQTTSTHKYIKYPLRETGFDLSKMAATDLCYYFDRATASYRRLDQDSFDKIQNGAIKF